MTHAGELISAYLDGELNLDDHYHRGIVNGQTVNECYNAFPRAGKILLQSEGFEIWFRKFELLPLKPAVSKK